MKEAKKTQVTEQICRQAQLMRKGGANQAQVAELLGINNSTVSRMEAAGFDYEKYIEMRRIRREREKKQKEKPKVELTVSSEELAETEEEQVPGQIRMILAPAEILQPAEDKKADPEDLTKLMRFQAGQADKIIGQMMVNVDALLMKLDRLNDMLSMILRAVRKE